MESTNEPAVLNDLASLAKQLSEGGQKLLEGLTELYESQKKYIEGQGEVIALLRETAKPKERLTLRKKPKFSIKKEASGDGIEFTGRGGLTKRKFNLVRSKALRRFCELLAQAPEGAFVDSHTIADAVRPLLIVRRNTVTGGANGDGALASKRASSLRQRYSIAVESDRQARGRGVLVPPGIEGYRLRPSVNFFEPMRDVRMRAPASKRPAKPVVKAPAPVSGSISYARTLTYLDVTKDELDALIARGEVKPFELIEGSGKLSFSRQDLRNLLRRRHG